MIIRSSLSSISLVIMNINYRIKIKVSCHRFDFKYAKEEAPEIY